MQSIRDFKKIGNVFWADHRMLLAAGYKAYSSDALCKGGALFGFYAHMCVGCWVAYFAILAADFPDDCMLLDRSHVVRGYQTLPTRENEPPHSTTGDIGWTYLLTRCIRFK
jgi:hypothetical protein